MALKTLRFVQGLPRTPLLLFDISKPEFPKLFPNNENLEIWKSENMKIGKPRFTNKCPDYLSASGLLVPTPPHPMCRPPAS